jgi:acyl carrier protein
MNTDVATNVAQRLIAKVSEVSGVSQANLSPHTPLHEIGLDSIYLAIILRGVETEFSIEFDDEEIADLLGASLIGEYVDIVLRASSRKANA